MLETTGNLWTTATDIRVITTNGFVKSNGECVMGRGCAKEARDKYPGLATRLGSLINNHGNRAFAIHEINLATMPVKHNWWEPADLNLIVKSAGQLVELADKFEWSSILLPRPGCGNGQLSWEDVSPFISDILDDRFTVITF